MLDGSLNAVLLRPLAWLGQESAQVGHTITLEMSEQGIRGPARVLKIQDCPELDVCAPGQRIITGTFVRPNVPILEVWIEGETTPIETTQEHPFWSSRLKGWTRAGNLKAGDEIRRINGESSLVSRTTLKGTEETVYNLEVHRDHTFAVSRLGVWVHNSCSGGGHGGDADAARGGTYKLKDTDGNVRRTGRTNDLDRREGEHRRGADTKDLDFEVDRRTDDYAAQRGREELIHDQHPEARVENGGLNSNIPISDRNPNRDRYREAGRGLDEH